MNLLTTKWWSIEDERGTPLASDFDPNFETEERQAGVCRSVLIFSEREYAEHCLAAAELSAARIVLHSGRYEAACFLEKVGKLGALRMIVDAGQSHAHWFAINPESWRPLAVNRARARQIGLEVAT